MNLLVQAMGLKPERETRSILAESARAWFNLTVDEQRAVVIVLGLFLLGVAVRAWHVREKECRRAGEVDVGAVVRE